MLTQCRLTMACTMHLGHKLGERTLTRLQTSEFQTLLHTLPKRAVVMLPKKGSMVLHSIPDVLALQVGRFRRLLDCSSDTNKTLSVADFDLESRRSKELQHDDCALAKQSETSCRLENA